MTFLELQNEIKRGAIRDQGGTIFDEGVKTVINRALLRLVREANWKPLRRKTTFTTKTEYTTGTGAVSVTADSKNVTVTGATFITDSIAIGRRISFGGSSTVFTIATITGETTLTIDRDYDGDTSTTDSYSILPQEEYNVPIQAGYNLFLWHEQWGSHVPYLMNYIPDQSFYGSGVDHLSPQIPTHYRMWGEDMVIEQLLAPSVVTISSSSASDTSISLTVFGTVSGYPDYEIITTDGSDGTTPVSGSKTFSSIERVAKSSSSVGRITATGNTGNSTIAVLTVGNTTTGIQYKKIQLYPLPNASFPMNVRYYKYPYKLVNDGDIHELGEEFDQALIFLSIALLKYENNQDEGDKFISLYSNEIKLLKKTNVDKIDWLPRLQRPMQGRSGTPRVQRNLSYSQAGPFYGPRTSW